MSNLATTLPIAPFKACALCQAPITGLDRSLLFVPGKGLQHLICAPEEAPPPLDWLLDTLALNGAQLSRILAVSPALVTGWRNGLYPRSSLNARARLAKLIDKYGIEKAKEVLTHGKESVG